MARLLGGLAFWCCLGAAASAAAPPGSSLRPPPEVLKEIREAYRQWERAAATARLEDSASALPIGERAVARLRAVLGDHPFVANMLARLADWAEDAGKYDRAVALCEEVVSLRTKLYPAGDWRTVNARLELADARRLKAWTPAQHRQRREIERLVQEGRKRVGEGDFDGGLKRFESALALTRKLYGDRHRETASRLTTLAGVLRDRADYAAAEKLLLQTQSISRAVHGEDHPEFAHDEHNLAALYWSMRDYRKAEPLFLRALAVQERHLRDDDRELARTRANLAQLYFDTGRLALALALSEQALAVRKGLGEQHPDYAYSLHNLSSIHRAMGDLDKAKALLEQALALRRKHQGKSHLDVAFTLNNLAQVYGDLDQPKKALAANAEALAILRARLGDDHPLTIQSRSNRVALLYRQGDSDQAVKLVEQNLAAVKKAHGPKHPIYALTLNNLGTAHWAAGDVKRAVPLFEEALKITRDSLGDRHPNVILILENLAVQHVTRGEPKKGAELFRKSMDLTAEQVDRTLGVLSERQRMILLGTSRRYLSLYLGAARDADLDAAEMYEPVLAWKGVLAARQAEERALLDKPDLKPLVLDLRGVRARLARLSQSTPAAGEEKDWREAFDALEADKEAIESKLARGSASYRSARRAVRPAELAKALPARAALVDLIVYRHFLGKPEQKAGDQFEERVLAFVVVPGRRITCVGLGASKPIDDAVRAWRRPVVSSPPGAIDSKAAAELRRLVWVPIARALGPGIDSVHVVPDGALTGLPLAALPGARPGRFLIEEVAIGYLPSARDLVAPKADLSSLGGLLVLGGLEYGKGKPYAPLPGTGLEADQIARSYRTAFPTAKPPLLLNGDRGDRSRLLRELTAPRRWLHLATHGYFDSGAAVAASESGEMTLFREQPLLLRNPLLSSGLVLSGGNHDPRDGFLTAEEVASLDLRLCELVVLSACETGLGMVANGEGVMGLQRAFHQAGARGVMTSLWSVSDPATSALMEEFYSRLWAKKKVTKLEALRQAQLYVLNNPDKVAARAKELRQKAGDSVALRGISKKAVVLPEGMKGDSKRSHPAWWAAFVLSGDPAESR